MKLKRITESARTQESMAKLITYMNEKFGSPIAFKALKYFLENKLARDRKGYAIYELTFNIPPSLVLTKTTLAKILTIADGTSLDECKRAVDLLVQKGILRVDQDTQILDLATPLEKVSDLYLQETDHSFEEAKEMSDASVFLLQTGTRSNKSPRKASVESSIVGVIDMGFKEKDGQFSIIENKFVG
jgi:hypothetical protein